MLAFMWWTFYAFSIFFFLLNLRWFVSLHLQLILNRRISKTTSSFTLIFSWPSKMTHWQQKIHFVFPLCHATVQHCRPQAPRSTVSFIAAAAPTPSNLPQTLIYNTQPTQTSSLRENKQQHTRVSNIIILPCLSEKKKRTTEDKKPPWGCSKSEHCCDLPQATITTHYFSPLTTHSDWLRDIWFRLGLSY